MFVAIGNSVCYTSYDSINWTAVTVPAQYWRTLTYSSECGVIVASASSGTNNRIITSKKIYNNTSRTTLPSLTCTGALVAQTPICSLFYGKPSLYDSTGGAKAQPTTSAAYYYLLFPTASTNNWTPSYTTTCKLNIPYTGIYAITFTFESNSSNNQIFVSRSTMNAGDLDSANLLCSGGGQLCMTCSATAYLLSTDYISFGYYASTTSSCTTTSRCRATVTLIQRSA